MLLPGAGDAGRARDVLLLLPTAFVGVPGADRRVGGGVGRRPRAALPRAGRGLPGQPDHRPPRRAAAGAAQHRLAAPGLGAARRGGLRVVGAGRLPAARSCDRCSGWPSPRPSPRSSPGRWRRSGAGRHGVGVVRAIVARLRRWRRRRLHVTGRLTDFLDHLPDPCWSRGRPTASGSRWLAGDRRSSWSSSWSRSWSVRCPPTSAARRPPRDEARVESGRYAARRTAARPSSARSSASTAARCGARCRCAAASPSSAVGPGLVAIAGGMPWQHHDDPAGPGRLGRRAALRRQRLVPRRPRPAVAREPAGAARPGVRRPGLRAGRVPARRDGGHHPAGRLRAGVPDSRQLAAARVHAGVVVTVQVVAAAMRWSAQRPFPVDLRSRPGHPRATRW